MESIVVTRYKTVDGKIFDDAKSAKLHEVKLLQVKAFSVFAYPDNKTGKLRNLGYILVTAKHNHEMFASWFMYERFGNQFIFINNKKFSSDNVRTNWEFIEVDKAKIASLFDNEKNCIAVIEDEATIDNSISED